MSSRFAVILAAIIIIFGGIFVINKNKSDSPGSNGKANSAQATNHTKGTGTTGVTLVEYGDFQCPACTAYHPVVNELIKSYGDKITFQFVNFPLYQIHQNAMVAHRAAEAADKQGKFWEMYDLLYINSAQWSSASNPVTSFESFAQQLGLNVDKFRTDSASSGVNDIINADLEKGRKAGVDATPAFFLNGKKIEQNPQSVEDFKKLIDNEIANKAKS
jgi:protein-disulfide isomerase